MARRHLAIPSRAELRQASEEAAEARQKLAYEAGRFAEVFSKVLEIYARRTKPDDDQRNDQ